MLHVQDGDVDDIFADYSYTKVYLMQVSKWGNSLAIRLPATVVEALELKEGDEIEVTITGQRNFSVDRDQRKKVALERIIKRGWTLPRGFKFDREGANER
jgi:antitoxin MazE